MDTKTNTTSYAIKHNTRCSKIKSFHLNIVVFIEIKLNLL